MMGVLFHAGAVLRDRNRRPVRDPKPGAKASKFDPNGNPIDWDEEDKRDAVHGHVAIMALDSTVKSDAKDLEADPSKWAKKIGQREKIAEQIAAAINEGDGWVELSDDHRDLLVDRLAQCALGMTNANIGPIIYALTDGAPKALPAEVKAKKRNGAAEAEAHAQG